MIPARLPLNSWYSWRASSGMRILFSETQKTSAYATNARQSRSAFSTVPWGSAKLTLMGFPEHLRQKLRATAICAEQRTLQRAKQCEVICVWEPRTCDPLPVSRKPKWGGSSRGE